MALTDNLVAYWKLDESSGDAADASGNSKTLTNVSTVTYSAGKINNGADFSGSNRLERASSDTSFQFERTQAFSQQCWFKCSDANYSFYMGRADSQVDGTGYALAKTNNTASSPARCQLATSTTSLRIDGTTDIITGNWVHLVMTYDGSSNATGLKLYVNGTAEGSSTADASISTTTIGANDEFCLGSREAGNQGLIGSLDECAVWSRELTAAEVTQLYNGGAGLAYPLVPSTGSSKFLMFM